MELTIKQYAENLHLSYEACRASFKTHVEKKDLLEGVHYRKEGRAKILTEAGIEKMNGYRKKPVMITPGDVSALNTRISALEEQIKDLKAQKDALEAENADLRLQIVGLEAKISEKSDALIECLMKLQNANEKLLTTTAPAAAEPKKGFFSRLFSRK